MKILLHICCAPCSTYPVELLVEKGYEVVGFFYNPNIYPGEELIKREEEARRFFELKGLPFFSDLSDVELWYRLTNKLKDRREGDIRCNVCFAMRLDRAAREARRLGIELFTTTLTVAPMKSSKKIFRIGNIIARKYGLTFLLEDFKKKDGFKKSCIISKEFNMYRQDYCGCEYSLMERGRRRGGD
jgi:predicted adenine nucleotide alpha hydrolase (AANH) superfamily ATPase